MEGNLKYFVDNWLIFMIICLVISAIVIFFLIRKFKKVKKKMEKDMFELNEFNLEKEEKFNVELLSSAENLNKNSEMLRNGLKEHYDKLAKKEKEIQQYVAELKKVYDETKANRMAIEKVINII